MAKSANDNIMTIDFSLGGPHPVCVLSWAG